MTLFPRTSRTKFDRKTEERYENSANRTRLMVFGIVTATLVATLGVRHTQAIIIQTTDTAIAGISSGQTARLALFNRGQEHGIIIQGVRFVASDGAVLLEFQETEPGRPIMLQPGEMRSFDLNRDSLGGLGEVNGRI